jgi:transaldolase
VDRAGSALPLGRFTLSNFMRAHLAGCDLMTISPQLLREIQEKEVAVERKLDATKR